MATGSRDRLSSSRLSLTRDRVLRAAIALADQGGIDGLSMRRLGQELGVEAMSLYNHVANKDDILSGMVDLIVSEFELPDPGADWQAAVRLTAISAHDVLVEHPWAASVMLSVTGSSPARWRYMDALLGTLRRAGFSAEQTDHAYHTLDSHITGYTLWQVQIQADPTDLPDLAERFLEALPVDAYPDLVAHVHQHLRDRNPDDEGAFAFGLDLILDGLARIRDATAPAVA
ncbi:MAG: TetR/AcrR family transcriptional regulator C-terminal domain-containing protein [Chloroflexota bacterium]|nr:TetR/AcrR family transcriptional regulator C-terminal domain-containing protein [Chloroflexota bacterium]